MTLNPKLDNTCVLCLPFEEPDGSIAYDISNYGNHGTIYGATRTLGRIGKALSFNGSTDYVGVTSPSFALTDKLTVMAWVKPNDVDAICDILSRSYAPQLFSINPHTSWIYFYFVGTTPGPWNCASSKSFIDGRFHLIAGTFDNSLPNNQRKIFIDGVLDIEIDTTGSITSDTTPLYIGKRLGTMYPFNGLIDEVRIYNRALSAKEVYTHYIYGLQRLRQPRFPEFRAEVRRKLWPSAVV